MKTARFVAWFLVIGAIALFAGMSGCSSKSGGSQATGGDDGGGASSGSYGGSGSGTIMLGDGSFGGGNYNISPCMNGGTTTISGRVLDPAGANPLYNVTVFIPQMGYALPKFTNGPNNCASCASLFPMRIAASALTDAHGHYQIKPQNMMAVPDGKNLPLVVQVGKWRKQYNVNITACQDNPQPDLRLPRNHTEGDLPNMAISTGAADSLECLLRRMGVDASEYTGGPTGAGKLHIFTGYQGATTNGGGSPDPNLQLWDSMNDINQFDVILLSCEGQETTFANITGDQTNMWNYTLNGGRVFASHFHYAWFNTGPFSSNVMPPLASWTTGVGMDAMQISGKVATTLSNGMTFPEGVALDTWLTTVGALTSGELPIQFAKHNAQVTATSNSDSTVWITSDVGSMFPGGTEYFSFDTPPGGGDKCGRVVYSDLHVSGGPGQGAIPDYPGFQTGGIVPDGCGVHPLTPQEKALEFMIFDLSSCLIPIGMVGTPPMPQ
jgi:hypothetical protein